MGYHVVYSDSTDLVAPTISTVAGVVSGTNVTFTVTTPDADSRHASVLYLVTSSTASHAWVHVDLTSSDNHTFTGIGPVPAGTTAVEQYFVQVVDAANNVSTSSKKGQDFSAQTALVAGAPVITVSGTSIGGSYVGPQQVTITGDGIVSYALDGATQAITYAGPFTVGTTGTHTVTAWIGDTHATVTFTIVGTPLPSVTISSPSADTTYIVGAVIPAVFSCAGYQIVSCAASPATPDNTVGSHTFSVTATDASGGTFTRSVTYAVRWGFLGLFQPVNDAPNAAMSVFKQGSTVPIKFQLVDTAGALIPDAAAAALASACDVRLSVAKAGSTASPVDESVYTAPADSGSCFRYDSSARQFTYNLGTKGLSAGATYVLTIHFTASDGVDHVVRIGLR
jgi:hypothetical protein